MNHSKHKLSDRGGYEGDSLLALSLVLVVRTITAIALATAAVAGGSALLDKLPL